MFIGYFMNAAYDVVQRNTNLHTVWKQHMGIIQNSSHTDQTKQPMCQIQGGTNQVIYNVMSDSDENYLYLSLCPYMLLFMCVSLNLCL